MNKSTPIFVFCIFFVFCVFIPRVDTGSTPDPQEGFLKEEPKLNSTLASIRDHPHSWKTQLGRRNPLLWWMNHLLRSRKNRSMFLPPEEPRNDGAKS